jgi:catechol 2,3-dioxygenase-like lactoylglutathione lyase family enzyme
MKSTISRLLKNYEDRNLSRRELVEGLALLAAGAGAASAAAGFQGNSISHVSLYVSNLQRSTDFYKRTFGLTVSKGEPNLNQLMLGKSSFLLLREGKPPGKVDHFAIGVPNFDKASLTADLKARGATALDVIPRPVGGGLGFHVMDPDGFPVQITQSK